eukprot:Skav207245  [mRNA]  locus=scaffold523:506977:514640:- [translate_table: standard]
MALLAIGTTPPASSSAWGATGQFSVLGVAAVLSCAGVAKAVQRRAVSYKKVFFFPGQGAQSVGMCKELVEARLFWCVEVLQKFQVCPEGWHLYLCQVPKAKEMCLSCKGWWQTRQEL